MNRVGTGEEMGDGEAERRCAKEENKTEAEASARQRRRGRRKINKANLDLSARKSLR